MPRVPSSPWYIPYAKGVPRDHSFFLSHVREDNRAVTSLRRYVAAEFRRRRIPAGDLFLDIHHWPRGKASVWAIRNALLTSEFMIAWVTPAYLKSTRGWIWMELALGQLIEDSLNLGMGLRFPFVLAVFRGVSVSDIAKTPWIEYLHRGIVAPHEALSVKAVASRLVEAYQRELQDRPAH